MTITIDFYRHGEFKLLYSTNSFYVRVQFQISFLIVHRFLWILANRTKGKLCFLIVFFIWKAIFFVLSFLSNCLNFYGHNNFVSCDLIFFLGGIFKNLICDLKKCIHPFRPVIDSTSTMNSQKNRRNSTVVGKYVLSRTLGEGNRLVVTHCIFQLRCTITFESYFFHR